MRTANKIFGSLLLALALSSCKKDESDTASKNNLDVVVSVPSAGFHCNNKFVVQVFSSASNSRVVYGTVNTNGGTYSTTLNPGSYYIVVMTGSSSPDFTGLVNSESQACKECGDPVTITSATQKQTVTISRWCEFGVVSSNDHCN